jgi:hypothetical protein
MEQGWLNRVAIFAIHHEHLDNVNKNVAAKIPSNKTIIGSKFLDTSHFNDVIDVSVLID